MSGPGGARISRRNVLDLADALGVTWNGLDSMPRLFQLCVERARRLNTRRAPPGAAGGLGGAALPAELDVRQLGLPGTISDEDQRAGNR